MALPLAGFAAVALVALIVANAIALPAGKLTRFLAFFAVGRTLTAAPLTFSPLILNLYTAFATTMGTEYLALAATVVATNKFFA